METTLRSIGDGSYPGGPVRNGPEQGSAVGPSRELRGLAEAEERTAALQTRHRRIERRRRLVVGVFIALALALGAGLTVARRDSDGPSNAASLRSDVGAEDVEMLLARERRRILEELWKMEDLEIPRGRR